MTSNDLITNVIYYSLFHKELFEDKINLIKYLPKNVFGVFSTIRRASKIISYPIDIHGCIGYWDPNFNTLNNKTLYENLLRVSYDSVWSDNRNKYFSPIQTDPNSFLEIDFMMNPLYKIDKKTGIISNLNIPFTNNIFGIIIQTKDKSHRATYLPKVFPSISWNKLILSIKNKANITFEDFDLFAYKIIQVKSTFITLLTNNIFSYISIQNFTLLLLNNIQYKLNFPLAYSCKNNMLEWNYNDNVRNISTLGDIFKYITIYPNLASKTQFNFIKQKIFDILNNIQKYSSQSLSFLGFIFQLLNINNEEYCKKLLTDLPSAEEEFEKPEIIIGLNKSGCTVNAKYYNYPLIYTSDDSIFKMNWIIQAIISYNKRPSNQLIKLLENKINNIIANIQNIETNYIAVSFEALCFVYGTTRQKKILHKIFQLFFELEKRKNCYNTFYTFLDKRARVDISEHVINGLIELN
jgi:AMMECR1